MGKYALTLSLSRTRACAHALTSTPHATGPADETTGDVTVGLVEMVVHQLADPEPREPNTLEEMDVWGHADPVPYDYGYTTEGVDDGVALKDNGTGFFVLLKKVANITEQEVEKWFGPARNVVRDRAIMLVENGHINPASLRIMAVTKKIRDGAPSDTVHLLEAKVCPLYV